MGQCPNNRINTIFPVHVFVGTVSKHSRTQILLVPGSTPASTRQWRFWWDAVPASQMTTQLCCNSVGSVIPPAIAVSPDAVHNFSKWWLFSDYTRKIWTSIADEWWRKIANFLIIHQCWMSTSLSYTEASPNLWSIPVGNGHCLVLCTFNHA